MNSEALLINTISQYGVSIDPFRHYLELLQKWNKAYNLTAVAPQDMIAKHFLDSLAILPWVKGTTLLDVGSGAGFPGIPLALIAPSLHVVLLDSNGKKTRFLTEVKRVLSLSNVDIVQTRVEDYRSARSFDTVTSRALGTLFALIQNTKHLVAPDGIWLAMKGQFPQQELDELNRPYQVESYTVPGVLGARHCIIMNNKMKESA